jgi:hypothetical protein
MHTTKTKGDLAVAKVITNLIEKDYEVLQPFSEHLPFDLVAYRDNTFIRMQVKHSLSGIVKNRSGWVSKKKNHIRKYDISDFDYYALYIAPKNVVIYIPSNMGGKQIRITLPNRDAPFYWYEDYLNLSYVRLHSIDKKTLKDFGIVDIKKRNYKPRMSSRKHEWPDKETLENLLGTKPLTHIAKFYKVTDSTIKDWARHYNLTWPGRGYWQKLHSKVS